MKKSFLLKVAVILTMNSLFLTLPTIAFAGTDGIEKGEKSVRFASVDELKELNDYMDDYNGVSSKMKKATNLYVNGMIDYENGDKKEAKKDFKEANKKFIESNNALTELDPPSSVKNLNDLTEDALDKYISGTKTAVKAVKTDDILMLGESAATMAQGFKLESQAVVEVGLVLEKLIEGAFSKS